MCPSGLALCGLAWTLPCGACRDYGDGLGDAGQLQGAQGVLLGCLCPLLASVVTICPVPWYDGTSLVDRHRSCSTSPCPRIEKERPPLQCSPWTPSLRGDLAHACGLSPQSLYFPGWTSEGLHGPCPWVLGMAPPGLSSTSPESSLSAHASTRSRRLGCPGHTDALRSPQMGLSCKAAAAGYRQGRGQKTELR